ncbi:hypothetical protein OH773_06775 [Buttiauxella sp. WJP83]|uniref:hypothetical protein n=1 Tax=Buttiauxella sp. WJP83 TaxID=2986951 RepID=UPI0022DD0F4D|nr:hypothetical protein [Buttiauxella sp. WJP83]WBM71939.1 hypothetical protein OH773_06775 [Buttiauxella sp. WJP83]
MKANIEFNDRLFDQVIKIANENDMNAYQYIRELVACHVAYTLGIEESKRIAKDEGTSK